jgi:hypothetical protein
MVQRRRDGEPLLGALEPEVLEDLQNARARDAGAQVEADRHAGTCHSGSRFLV